MTIERLNSRHIVNAGNSSPNPLDAVFANQSLKSGQKGGTAASITASRALNQ